MSGGGQAATAGRIRHAFDTARDDGRAALIPFLAAGDPDLQTTVAMALAAAEAGADVIELGVPYSDPLADGPVIQAAYTRALAAGATLDGVFETVQQVAAATEVPLVLMTSVSPVLARGIDRFCRDAAAAGAAGLLVPDLLPEDAGDLRAAAAEAGLETVFLTVPWAPDERVRAAAEASTGFLYLVSRRGVTGASGIGNGAAGGGAAGNPAAGAGAAGGTAHRSGPLAGDVARVRSLTHLPVAVGFGVAGPEDAAAVAASADGVIVGSALVAAAQAAGRDGAAAEVRERVAALRAASRRGEVRSGPTNS